MKKQTCSVEFFDASGDDGRNFVAMPSDCGGGKCANGALIQRGGEDGYARDKLCNLMRRKYGSLTSFVTVWRS